MPSTEMIEWTASAGRIHANGEVFNIKGANWFGTEGQHAMLYGLEKHGAGEEGVEFVKTAIPTYREELSSDAARALPGEGEHC